MTKEQEAQQAQTIANEIESAKIAGNNKRVIDLLEEIVDSQAQKIAEQAKEIERLETTYDLIPLDAEQQRLRS